MPELTLVKYQTFIDHLGSGEVSNVSIYNFAPNVEITYSLGDAGYATQAPFGANQDTLLHRTLESKSIVYSLLDSKYDGPEVSTDRNEYWSGVIFAVPLVLVLVVLIQAVVIKRLSAKISIDEQLKK